MRMLVVVFGLFVGSIAVADTKPPMLAVLEFDSPDQSTPFDELQLLTDAFRSAVVKETGARFKVLTRETMVQLVPPEKLRCFAGMCAAEIGKQLQAQNVISASVRKLGAKKILTIEAYESNGGRLLGSEQLKAENTERLIEAIEKQGQGLVRSWLSLSARPAEGEARVEKAANAALGTLLVTSDVEGAEISINGRPQGVSAGRKEASFSLSPGRMQVKASKGGYLDDLKTIELKAGDTSRVTLHLEAESKVSTPAPIGGATSFLTVSSEPKGAVITIDDKKVGKTPRSVEVAPGKHRVGVSLEWYVDAQAEVTVAEGASQKVELTLAPAFGQVEITTTPAQATVFLDGRQVGTTEPTLSLPRVTPGKHVVKVTRTDFHDAEISIDVAVGKTLSVKVPSLKPSVGSLKVISEPAGARVVIDGREAGKTPATVERLSDGPHVVKLKLDDHDDWEGSMAVVEGEVRELKVPLESLLGMVEVSSTPPGQLVAVDGEAKGTTPARLSLLEGEHRVRVGSTGTPYVVREERVTVVRRKSRRLDFALEALFGRLVIVTDPPEASVSVDGKEVGPSPVQLPRVPVGDHSLEARTKGGASASQVVRIEAGKETKVRVEVAGFEQRDFPEPVVELTEACPSGMVLIQGGAFDMGSPEGDESERPVHRVIVGAYCVDRTEHADTDGMPTVNVDWSAARTACDREGKRLPTEAEWEFAARGAQGRRYPWGKTAPSCEKANFDQCRGSAVRVGSLSNGATPEGVHDLAGNVTEWVADCYEKYGPGEQQDAVVIRESCEARVLRGGSFSSRADGLRASGRDILKPTLRRPYVGFRCVLGMTPARASVSSDLPDRKGVSAGVGTFLANGGSIDGLEWQSEPSRKPLTWLAAKSYCARLSLNGGGWRLPTKAELKGLFDLKATLQGDKSIKGLNSRWFWTSNVINNYFAASIDFASGGVGDGLRGSAYGARCVR